MNRIFKKPFGLLLAAASLVLGAGQSALADDSEIFSGPGGAGIAPNVLFILDTSGSMSSALNTQKAYDPGTSYSGVCKADQLYFQSSQLPAPSGCTGLDYFPATSLACVQASAAFGPSGPGYYQDSFIQWQANGSNYSWSPALSGKGLDVQCLGDYTAADAKHYPTTYSGPTNSTATEWTTNTTDTNSYWNLGGAGGGYVLYSGNYLNYLAGPPPTVASTRIQIVQQAGTNFINSISGMNIGLMRYSNNNGGSNDTSASGGMVAYPVSHVWTDRANLITTLNNYNPAGWTPLSETLYEAYLYYSGGPVHFGLNSKPFASVPGSLDPQDSTRYKSPITTQCQKNYIIYLTDGLPTQDNEADSLITGLPDESTLGGSCDDTSQSPYNGKDASGNAIPGGWGPAQTAGKCMTALARYLNNADLSSAFSGTQSVQLYTIGFGNDSGLAAASGWLKKAATAGGGKFFLAKDTSGLQAALSSIVSNVLTNSTTFTAPVAPVNPQNASSTVNNLYLTLFQPSTNWHWPGNLKKYKLDSNGNVLDANNNAALDTTTGFIKDGTQSIWSTVVDGGKVPLGGAASQIPTWDPAQKPSRNVYTYIGASPTSPVDLTGGAYAFKTTNTAITNALLGVNDAATHDAVINYARGENLKSENNDTTTTDTRHAMGDSLHSAPAVMIYNGTTTAQNINDGAAFVATNDGFLHAFDINDGHELWSFIPQEMLQGLLGLYSNNATSPKHYGLDGTVQLLVIDFNHDGVIDAGAGDRVLLFVGAGRGGNNYYAFDVTSKTTPKLLWSVGRSTPGMSTIGQTWSNPKLARVNISGATQNNQKLVLIFGGGYDTTEEAAGYQIKDSSGNGLYMIDALTGSLLWSAGPSDSTTAQLKLANMDHAIPSDVLVIDLDGDGYADRMYVGDMGGQLWRFDIFNGNAADKLVTGGRIASLGTHDDTTHDDTAARRFYYPPDWSVVSRRGMPTFLNLAIGSGYRGHPLNTSIQDRFYSIRDYQPYAKLTTDQYAKLTVIKDSDPTLVDVTTTVTPTMGDNPEGWKLRLTNPGEKVLSRATVLPDRITFVTYMPGSSSTSCSPALGSNMQYAVSILNAAPVANLSNQGNQKVADRSAKMAQVGIAPGVTLILNNLDPAKATSSPPTTPAPPQCVSGAEVLKVCRNFNTRMKTWWSESDAN
jgi:type IV pilus assembly protein PilY1